ncbi:Anaphase-promoting complex subunit 1 [Coemansia sp. RSA 1646]|nr:Anaphase-promoting complex subunit 1 [Coemansia sp. RSA 1646]KAJ2088281.1 Anaphase-promoting complex subunit 1 [Coemansia sp. RSA 986]
MPQSAQRVLFAQPSSAAIASLDDAATAGYHRAFLSKGVVSWSVDGRFLRSFRLNSTAKPLVDTQDAVHLVFAKFNDSGGADSTLSVSLCIFGSDTLTIHCYSGESYTVALPFGVQNVAALREGIVVQRRAADPADSSPFSSNIPTFFSLLGPRSEFKMIGLSRPADLDAIRKLNGREIVLSPTPAKHSSGTVPVFNDPNAMLVAAATSRHGSAPRQFVLCWDTTARRHTLYQCVVLERTSECDSQRGTSSDIHTDPMPTRRTSTSDTERPSASRPRLNRQASLSVHRRSSAAVSAAAIAAVSRRKSGYSTAVKNDRRGSLLGRVSFNDSPGIGYAADMFSEQRQMRAEVVLHRRWKDKRPKDDTDRTRSPPGTDMCVVQTASGKDIVCILNKMSKQIIGIDVLTFTEIFRCSAHSMTPVQTLSRGLDDLVVVDPSGHIAILAICSDNSSSKGDGAVAGDDGCHGYDLIRLNTVHQGHVVDIDSSEGSILSAVVDNSDSRVAISARINISRLAAAVLSALSLVLPKESYFLLWRSVVASLLKAPDALSEMGRISSLLLSGSDKGHPAPVTLALRVMNEIRNRSAAVLYVLQLVYEDAALYKSESQPRLSLLGRLLFQLADRAGFSNASIFYLSHGLFLNGSSRSEHSSSSSSSSYQQHSSHHKSSIVPSLAKWATAALTSINTRPLMFPGLSDSREIFDITDSEPARGAYESLVLLDTFSNIVYNLAAGHDPMRVLQNLAAAKNPGLILSQMRPEFQWIICSAMLRLRDLSTVQWPEDVLRFLGRLDLIANSSTSISTGIGCTFGSQYTIGSGTSNVGSIIERKAANSQSVNPSSIADLCGQIRDLAANTSNSLSPETNLSAEYREVGQRMFSSDLRVEEVERLLDDNAVTYTTGALVSAELAEDPDEAKMRYMDLLARRVFALPLGQALLKYSTCNLNSQASLTASPPRVKARFRGNKVETDWSAEETDVCWPLFHSGVAAALTIDRNQLRQAHPSWVLLHWPSEATANADNASDEETKRKYKDALSIHAGFLFGMGLISNRDSGSDGKQPLSNGPLCNMPPWQAFKYLSIRHSLTSSALLLGRSCAHRGTMDTSLSKILSLHIPNLLPPGSAEMMLLSYGTQAAAMLGLGLLFMKSQNRRMAEVMLHELSNVKRAAPDVAGSRIDDADPAEGTAECYSLASGFALGLVALGRGLITRTLADLCLLDSLSEMLAGRSGSGNTARHHSEMPSDGRAAEGYGARFGSTASMFGRPNSIDVGSRVSDLGVIAAIGLVFVGTNYKPAAQRLSLPTTLNQLKVADPFAVLWKTLMQSLVMLDHIRPEKAWVESKVPSLPGMTREPRSADIQRIRLHVVSAACFSIALKHAGTEDRNAHSTILAYFDELASIAGRSALGYESSLTRSSAQLCLDIVCISAALVMAGSGDIEVMRRLRALHSISGNRSYGNHMASHMALGILFLGGGARFTISRSVDSIALLVIAFFPRFPQHYSDNREHLQAWRHLWSLCVEPRCLVVRDAITGQLCEDATAIIFKQNGDGNTLSEAIAFPTTMLALKNGFSMRLQAPGYIPLVIDMNQTTGAPASSGQRSVLYMQPRQQQAIAQFKESVLATAHIQQQYQEWLQWVQTQVLALIEQLAEGEQSALLMTLEEITRTLSAVETLRVFVHFLASPLFIDVADAAPCFKEDGSKSSKGNSAWVETTYLAWLAVRRSVLEFGCTDIGRCVLTAYWSDVQSATSFSSQCHENYYLVGG